MSNETEKTPQQTTAASEEPSKGRQPDYIIKAIHGEGRNEKWTDIGAGWQNDKGYITPKYHAAPLDPDKVVFQPREELERLRQERKDRQPIQQQSTDIPFNQ